MMNRHLADQLKDKLLQGSSIFLHGPPKIGKTSFSVTFPGPHRIYATEPGHKYLPDEVKKGIVRCRMVDGWSKFLADLPSISKKKKKTVIIDTIDNLWTQCSNYVCQKNSWDHPGDGAHGKGWDALKQEMLRGLLLCAEECESVNSTLIIISHSKREKIKTRSEELDRIECSLTNSARSVVLNVPDHIWYLGYDQIKDAKASLIASVQERCLWMSGNEVIEAGTRHEGSFKGQISSLRKDGYQHVLEYITKKKKAS